MCEKFKEMAEKNLAEEFRKIIDNMSDEELNQKLKELEPLHNVGPKADEYLAFLEENKEVMEKQPKIASDTEIKDIEPKYRIGDTFQRIGTRGYSWWKVEEIVYGAIEPIYVLKMMPSGKYIHEIGESELCENWYNITISNYDENELHNYK